MKIRPKLTDIAALAARHASLSSFGPDSANPYIAFRLEGADARLGTWIKRLPCPVIGIGSGPLERDCDVVLSGEEKLPTIASNIMRAPIAAMILVQHLRASESLNLEDALTAESFAYAAVQNGPEFKRWFAGHKSSPLPVSTESPLIVETEGVETDDASEVSLTFNRPDTRNAIDVEMRDALCEALNLALSINASKVRLNAVGAAFSTGGTVEEFGSVSDPATAHWIRSLRLPARRLAQLQGKLHVHLNGAAIGAGVEIAAFGDRVTASSKAWLQLPELKYGLIPGAGGTASLPRRIGRQRTAYMALSMEKIRAKTALEWGLIDAVIDAH